MVLLGTPVVRAKTSLYLWLTATVELILQRYVESQLHCTILLSRMPSLRSRCLVALVWLVRARALRAWW